MCGRDHEHLGLDRRGGGARRVPELGARRGQRVHHHEPLEAGERLLNLIGVGADARGGHARENQALHLAFERLVVNRHPRRVRGGLRHEVEEKIVVLGGGVAVPRLEQAGEELLVVDAEEVP